MFSKNLLPARSVPTRRPYLVSPAHQLAGQFDFDGRAQLIETGLYRYTVAGKNEVSRPVLILWIERPGRQNVPAFGGSNPTQVSFWVAIEQGEDEP